MVDAKRYLSCGGYALRCSDYKYDFHVVVE